MNARFRDEESDAAGTARAPREGSWPSPRPPLAARTTSHLVLAGPWHFCSPSICSTTSIARSFRPCLPKLELDARSFRPDDPLLKFKLGSLTTAFLVSYMLLSPVFGRLGDTRSRWALVGIGVIVWSLASGGSGIATTFAMLLLTRCLVGIGEAAYGPVAPAMLSDLYPERSAAG